MIAMASPFFRCFRFSLASMFLLMLVGACVFAWLRPPPEGPILVVFKGHFKRHGEIHHYSIWYPNGTYEAYDDVDSLGSMDSVSLGTHEDHESVGYYQRELGCAFARSELEYKGRIRPGDERLCEERFRALLAAIESKEIELKFDGSYWRAELPRGWIRLAEVFAVMDIQ
jgi:hypothetical protein